MPLRRLLSLLLLVLSPAAMATPVETQLFEWRVPSVESGLERLKAQFLKPSVLKDMEFVGAVLERSDGSFVFTHGHGRAGQKEVTFRIRRPMDLVLVGFWHTHGRHALGREFFSPTDANLVAKTGLPFYLITPEGEVRVLTSDAVSASKGAAGSMQGSVTRLPRGSQRGARVARDRIRV